MSAPRRIHRQGEYCPICGGTEYYEFSMKCCNCVRKIAAKTTRKTIKRKLRDHESWGMHTKPIAANKDKEQKAMKGVVYD